MENYENEKKIASETIDAMDVNDMNNWDSARVDAENADCIHDRRYYINKIRSLNLDREIKNMLIKLADFTIEVGNRLFKIGKFILNWILKVSEKYPNTMLGILIGFILTSLIASIPVAGHVLGAVLGPIIMLISGLTGFSFDSGIAEKAINAAISAAAV